MSCALFGIGASSAGPATSKPVLCPVLPTESVICQARKTSDRPSGVTFCASDASFSARKIFSVDNVSRRQSSVKSFIVLYIFVLLQSDSIRRIKLSRKLLRTLYLSCRIIDQEFSVSARLRNDCLRRLNELCRPSEFLFLHCSDCWISDIRQKLCEGRRVCCRSLSQRAG